jgi:site-specific DNA recombinase
LPSLHLTKTPILSTFARPRKAGQTGRLRNYRKRVADLQAAWDEPRLHSEATEIIRSLIDRIIVNSAATGVKIELVGDLAAIVNLGHPESLENKKAALSGAAFSATERRSVKVVAGAGFEPTTFRL